MSDTIDISQFGSFMTRLVESIDNPRAQEPLTKWEQEFAGDTGALFQSSEGPGGTPWAPLKNPRGPGHNQGSRPLIDAGDLMLSVISTAEGHLENISDTEVVSGTSIAYAGFQQFGTSRIPARPFLGITEKQSLRAGELVAASILQIIGRAA